MSTSPRSPRAPIGKGEEVTFAVATTVELRCYSFRPDDSAGAGQVPASKLVATQVATVTAGH